MSGPADAGCELCEAAPFTEWFHDDDMCWIAECEACAVPMVVWRRHDPEPPPGVRQRLHETLLDVVASHFVDEVWIDENMRSIPAHYHAHARPRGGFFGRTLTRRGTATKESP
ncbi:MAG: hypothetical protein QNM02_14905 [Acidimicrobiia bacterium]|nr:hypothetical protein [Acidimicrobiia bacterium]